MVGLYQQRFPKGWAWSVAKGSQLDAILTTAEDDMIAPILNRATDCGTVRDPFKAVDVEALGYEFGLELFTTGTEEQYRKLLATYVYTPYRTGSTTDMETVLHDAGFVGAVVVKNNNSQDLRPLVYSEPVMVAGHEDAYCGGEFAYCGYSGYDVLVNGPLKNDVGSGIGYDIGNDADYWGYVDIICGGVTYLPNGDIDTITELIISEEQKNVFERLILRTKPLHSWIVLGVSYINPTLIAQTGDPLIPTIAQTGDTIIPIIAQTGV